MAFPSPALALHIYTILAFSPPYVINLHFFLYYLSLFFVALFASVPLSPSAPHSPAYFILFYFFANSSPNKVYYFSLYEQFILDVLFQYQYLLFNIRCRITLLPLPNLVIKKQTRSLSGIVNLFLDRAADIVSYANTITHSVCIVLFSSLYLFLEVVGL